MYTHILYHLMTFEIPRCSHKYRPIAIPISSHRIAGVAAGAAETHLAATSAAEPATPAAGH